MRLTSVSVQGLFGVFDHDIPLRSHDRITIIHGPNGFGKTIILRMIEGLLSGDYAIFRTTPFSAFEVSFDDGTHVRLTKTFPKRDPSPKGKTRARRGDESIVCRISKGDVVSEFPLGQVLQRPYTTELLQLIDSQIPSPISLHGDSWFDPQQSRTYSVDEIVDQYWSKLRGPLSGNVVVVDEVLRNIRQHINVRLIRTQRLEPIRTAQEPINALNVATTLNWYHQPVQTESTLTVDRYSEELRQKMQATLGLYAARSQDLDRTFPERLLKQEREQQASLPRSELRKRFQDISDRRTRLVELGFIDLQGFGLITEELLSTKPDVLSIYVDDVEKKLGVFDDMVRRVGLLVRIVNERFAYKTLAAHRDKGFVITAQRTGVPLSPSVLSSGEQHELVLLFELIFKVSKTWLVLIDEPELSLHASWQQTFIDDLKEIVNLSNVDVVLATHSPTLIGENWDMTVGLTGPND